MSYKTLLLAYFATPRCALSTPSCALETAVLGIKWESNLGFLPAKHTLKPVVSLPVSWALKDGVSFL